MCQAAAACRPGGRARWVSVLLRPVRPPVSEVVCPGCDGEGGARGQEALIWVPRPALWAHGTLPEEGSVGGAGGAGRTEAWRPLPSLLPPRQNGLRPGPRETLHLVLLHSCSLLTTPHPAHGLGELSLAPGSQRWAPHPQHHLERGQKCTFPGPSRACRLRTQGRAGTLGLPPHSWV